MAVSQQGRKCLPKIDPATVTLTGIIQRLVQATRRRNVVKVSLNKVPEEGIFFISISAMNKK